MIHIEDITIIEKNHDSPGYSIHFSDGRTIVVNKKRTIPALLLLIKYTDGCESDLQGRSDRIPQIKSILSGKAPSDLINDFYADANKPFSELWTEDNFTMISNIKGDTRLGSQRYYLDPEEHDKLFEISNIKTQRASLTDSEKDEIRIKQSQQCNICKAIIYPWPEIKKNYFCRDRMREVFDHRIPVDKGGASTPDNYQALCFYCNKSKWQICNHCSTPNCAKCALAFPENTPIIFPTRENITDRM